MRPAWPASFIQIVGGVIVWPFNGISVQSTVWKTDRIYRQVSRDCPNLNNSVAPEWPVCTKRGEADKHLEWIESTFDFEAKTGRGSGMLQIVQGANGIWKGYMIVLKELKGAKENAGYRRPHG